MISEELLKQAAEEAAQAMADQIPEEAEHTFSAEFEEKMQKLREKAERPKVYPFLRRAACAVLALCLLGGVLMLNTEVRAGVEVWLRESFGSVDRYSTSNTNVTCSEKTYTLGIIPAGYSLYQENALLRDKVYMNSEKEMIQFTYLLDENSGNLYLFTENYTHSTANVNGHRADVYLAQKEGHNNSIVWSDSEGVLFWLSGPLDIEILIQMAENVRVVEK